MDNFKGKKVLIVGFGVEGKALAKFMLEEGANVTIADKKNLEDFPDEEINEFKDRGVEFINGESYLDSLEDFELICFSPGIKYEAYKKVKESGKKTLTQIQLFMERCKAKTVGVTGTNGKGTTTTLIYEILKAAGKKVYLGGNIGEEVLHLLPELSEEDWVVLELSSFQLRDLTISPHVGVVLNITSDHLDIHQTQMSCASIADDI